MAVKKYFFANFDEDEVYKTNFAIFHEVHRATNFTKLCYNVIDNKILWDQNPNFALTARLVLIIYLHSFLLMKFLQMLFQVAAVLCMILLSKHQSSKVCQS